MNKKILAFILFTKICSAQVVRSENSDLEQYRQFLINSQTVSFVQAFDVNRNKNREAYEMAGSAEFLELLKNTALPNSARELWYASLQKSASMAYFSALYCRKWDPNKSHRPRKTAQRWKSRKPYGKCCTIRI
jgi:hypothetical protein